MVKLFPQVWDPELAQNSEVTSYELIATCELEDSKSLPSLLKYGALEFVCFEHESC